MKQEIKDTVASIMAQGGQDNIDQMMMILELPDNQFDSVYPQFKVQLSNAFTDPKLQQEIIQAARLNPPSKEEIEGARKAIEDFVKEVDSDDTLSENKKDMLKTLIKSSAELTFAMADIPRERIGVKIQKIKDNAIIPKYAHSTDAGADIYAAEEVILKPHTTSVIPTGIKIAIPTGYEIQIRPRSGLSLKTPLRVANAPGTIDSDYRGEIGIIIENTGNLTQTIKAGDKIAQMVISPVPMIEWEEVDKLDITERNEGGFGSTGKS